MTLLPQRVTSAGRRATDAPMHCPMMHLTAELQYTEINVLQIVELTYGKSPDSKSCEPRQMEVHAEVVGVQDCTSLDDVVHSGGQNVS